jgi:hypothetical protein
MCTPVEVGDVNRCTLNIPDIGAVEVTQQNHDHGIGTWLVFSACGFGTGNAAKAGGEKFGEAILIAGAVGKLGVDVGFSRSTRQFGDQVLDTVKQRTGRELRPDIHGLMTFEQDSVMINTAVMRLSGSISGGMFEKHIAPWVERKEALTERQKNCAALLNDSFFVPSTEAQFVLRISAVEALCDATDVGDEFKNIIDSLKDHLEILVINECNTRETIRRRLVDMGRESIRQAYLAKFKMLLSEADAKAFDRLYRRRSTFLHEGVGRGNLLEAAGETLDLAVRLFTAELT